MPLGTGPYGSQALGGLSFLIPEATTARIVVATPQARLHVGDVWEPTATVINPILEQIAEPGGITFMFLAPNGRKQVVTPVKVATGTWRASITVNIAGPWRVSVVTTAPYAGSQPATIQVDGEWG